MHLFVEFTTQANMHNNTYIVVRKSKEYFISITVNLLIYKNILKEFS